MEELEGRGYQQCSDSDLHGRVRSIEGTSLPQQVHATQGLLQFWTYSSFFALAPAFKSDPALTSSDKLGLQYFSVVDRNGDWCGTILFRKLGQ